MSVHTPHMPGQALPHALERDDFGVLRAPPLAALVDDGDDVDLSGAPMSAPPPRAQSRLYSPMSARPAASAASSSHFIVVVPPPDLPTSALPTRSAAVPSHVRRGILLPLYPTLGGQLYAIAREFGLPSIGGVSLYLVDDGSGANGPRIGDNTWAALWGGFFEDQAPWDDADVLDDFSNEAERLDASTGRAMPMLYARPRGSTASPRTRAGSFNAPGSARRLPRITSAASLASTRSVSGSAAAFTLETGRLPIVARFEFAVDPARAKWWRSFCGDSGAVATEAQAHGASAHAADPTPPAARPGVPRPLRLNSDAVPPPPRSMEEPPSPAGGAQRETDTPLHSAAAGYTSATEEIPALGALGDDDGRQSAASIASFRSAAGAGMTPTVVDASLPSVPPVPNTASASSPMRVTGRMSPAGMPSGRIPPRGMSPGGDAPHGPWASRSARTRGASGESMSQPSDGDDSKGEHVAHMREMGHSVSATVASLSAAASRFFGGGDTSRSTRATSEEAADEERAGVEGDTAATPPSPDERAPQSTFTFPPRPLAPPERGSEKPHTPTSPRMHIEAAREMITEKERQKAHARRHTQRASVDVPGSVRRASARISQAIGQAPTASTDEAAYVPLPVRSASAQGYVPLADDGPRMGAGEDGGADASGGGEATRGADGEADGGAQGGDNGHSNGALPGETTPPAPRALPVPPDGATRRFPLVPGIMSDADEDQWRGLRTMPSPLTTAASRFARAKPTKEGASRRGGSVSAPPARPTEADIFGHAMLNGETGPASSVQRPSPSDAHTRRPGTHESRPSLRSPIVLESVLPNSGGLRRRFADDDGGRQRSRLAHPDDAAQWASEPSDANGPVVEGADTQRPANRAPYAGAPDLSAGAVDTADVRDADSADVRAEESVEESSADVPRATEPSAGEDAPDTRSTGREAVIAQLAEAPQSAPPRVPPPVAAADEPAPLVTPPTGQGRELPTPSSARGLASGDADLIQAIRDGKASSTALDRASQLMANKIDPVRLSRQSSVEFDNTLGDLQRALELLSPRQKSASSRSLPSLGRNAADAEPSDGMRAARGADGAPSDGEDAAADASRTDAAAPPRAVPMAFPPREERADADDMDNMSDSARIGSALMTAGGTGSLDALGDTSMDSSIGVATGIASATSTPAYVRYGIADTNAAAAQEPEPRASPQQSPTRGSTRFDSQRFSQDQWSQESRGSFSTPNAQALRLEEIVGMPPIPSRADAHRAEPGAHENDTAALLGQHGLLSDIDSRALGRGVYAGRRVSQRGPLAEATALRGGVPPARSAETLVAVSETRWTGRGAGRQPGTEFSPEWEGRRNEQLPQEDWERDVGSAVPVQSDWDPQSGAAARNPNDGQRQEAEQVKADDTWGGQGQGDMPERRGEGAMQDMHGQRTFPDNHGTSRNGATGPGQDWGNQQGEGGMDPRPAWGAQQQGPTGAQGTGDAQQEGPTGAQGTGDAQQQGPTGAQGTWGAQQGGAVHPQSPWGAQQGWTVGPQSTRGAQQSGPVDPQRTRDAQQQLPPPTAQNTWDAPQGVAADSPNTWGAQQQRPVAAEALKAADLPPPPPPKDDAPGGVNGPVLGDAAPPLGGSPLTQGRPRDSFNATATQTPTLLGARPPGTGLSGPPDQLGSVLEGMRPVISSPARTQEQDDWAQWSAQPGDAQEAHASPRHAGGLPMDTSVPTFPSTQDAGECARDAGGAGLAPNAHSTPTAPGSAPPPDADVSHAGRVTPPNVEGPVSAMSPMSPRANRLPSLASPRRRRNSGASDRPETASTGRGFLAKMSPKLKWPGRRKKSQSVDESKKGAAALTNNIPAPALVGEDSMQSEASDARYSAASVASFSSVSRGTRAAHSSVQQGAADMQILPSPIGSPNESARTDQTTHMFSGATNTAFTQAPADDGSAPLWDTSVASQQSVAASGAGQDSGMGRESMQLNWFQRNAAAAADGAPAPPQGTGSAHASSVPSNTPASAQRVAGGDAVPGSDQSAFTSTPQWLRGEGTAPPSGVAINSPVHYGEATTAADETVNQSMDARAWPPQDTTPSGVVAEGTNATQGGASTQDGAVPQGGAVPYGAHAGAAPHSAQGGAPTGGAGGIMQDMRGAARDVEHGGGHLLDRVPLISELRTKESKGGGLFSGFRRHD
ncbi:hypothetical protein MSPP1_000475 [Malassezia sp. CBS 17886]|nr:hypothetical protein MSPP1_000475 [Malassezia sp. CBS 17886]